MRYADFLDQVRLPSQNAKLLSTVLKPLALITFVAYQLVQLYQKFLNTAFLTDMVGFSSPVITSSDLRSPAVRMLSIHYDLLLIIT